MLIITMRILYIKYLISINISGLDCVSTFVSVHLSVIAATDQLGATLLHILFNAAY